MFWQAPLSPVPPCVNSEFMPNRRNAVYFFITLSLLGGLLTGRAFFFNLAYWFGGMLILSLLWAWISVRWIGISRKTKTSRTQVGKRLEESFTVTNHSLLPKLWLEVNDESTFPGHRAGHVVPWLSWRGSYRWTVETYCIVRGEFRLGPLTILSGDPFGLFLFPRRIAAMSRLIVYPAVVPIVKFALPSGVLSGGDTRHKRAQYTTTDAAGVREYVTGDGFNRIHWASTARRDMLMVKEFENAPKLDVWLLIDFSASGLVELPGLRRASTNGAVLPIDGALPPSSEEYAVSIGASLAQYLINSERALGFTAYTPHREVFQPERGARQLFKIMEVLAVARSISTYTLAQMLSLELPFMTRGTTLVIITASIDIEWMTQAQIAIRRGVRPVCILLDPQSFGGTQSFEDARTMLSVARIPTLTIRYGDDLTYALAQTPI